MTRLADLPKDVQRKILTGEAGVAGVAGSSVRRTPATPKPRAAAFQCFGCKQTWSAWAPAERHGRARECGTGRIECLFEREMT